MEQVMNFLKQSALIAAFAFIGLPTVQAEEVATLPTIRVMAESELREEVGFVPFQEDKKVRQALQHREYKTHYDIQNALVPEGMTTVDYQPVMAQPDLSQLSPFLQQYILAVAGGIQSSDPTNGIFEMLRDLNINRSNVDAYREGTMKVNIQDIRDLQQKIKDGLQGH
ncbi:peptide signal protein [Acinetobacter sp. 1124_18A]